MAVWFCKPLSDCSHDLAGSDVARGHRKGCGLDTGTAESLLLTAIRGV